MALGRQKALVILGFGLRGRRIASGKVCVEKHGGGNTAGFKRIKAMRVGGAQQNKNIKKWPKKSTKIQNIRTRHATTNQPNTTYSHKTDSEGLVARMIEFVHHQLHAGHLAPGVALGAFRHALREALLAAERLVGLHGVQHLAHLGHGLVVGRELAWF